LKKLVGAKPWRRFRIDGTRGRGRMGGRRREAEDLHL